MMATRIFEKLMSAFTAHLLIVELHASASARSRSEIRSATSSIPTEIRTSPSATPCARRVSAGRERSAEARRLAPRELVLGMRLEAWIEDAGDLLMVAQERRDLPGVVVVL